MADFITYEMNNNKDKLVREIINNHDSDIEINDEEFLSYISIVNKWVKDTKINDLKLELKTVTDINRKKELMDMITKIKRGSESYGK